MITEDQGNGLDIALNEAVLLGFEVDADRRLAAATFEVLTLPGPAPDDRRVQFVFHPVGRVAASLRNGRWDDSEASIVPFSINDLLTVVQSFKGLPIYGWEFIDTHNKELEEWGDRLSLDWTSGSDGVSHSITVFQDSEDRHLDLCVWFDDLVIRNPVRSTIPLDTFIAAGKRWWDALYAGDERTRGHGITPINDPST
jgi:hypothetical protein